YGRAAEGLPAEARQFDFLIGAYDAQQEFLRPNANSIKFPSTTTAVYALNGSAILEFSWYNVDPSLPNASTSIIRIYNRAMRRWESLFMTNRGNGNLFFGGYKESDRIILTLFEHNTSDPRISRFVFHSVEKDSYKWYGENSSDHGKSYQKFWIIEMKKHTGDVTVN
ncbi:MAG: hypothetical protein KDD94_11130, partial [Calditrichaeota bacterium]|nr:hypothetical protein [Calditrichota bacterium]